MGYSEEEIDGILVRFMWIDNYLGYYFEFRKQHYGNYLVWKIKEDKKDLEQLLRKESADLIKRLKD